MSKPRLVLFLSDVEGNLLLLRQRLTRACEEVCVSIPEVRWAEDSLATPFLESGWRVAEVHAPGVSGQAAPEAHLDALVRALARDFRDQILGLHVDRAYGHARVSLSEPGRPSRSLQGEHLDVLRQTARWLNVDTHPLHRLLGEGPARNKLAAAVDFGGPSLAPRAAPAPAEQDEDDRFVDAKLAEARQLMAQYLGQPK